MTTVNVRRATRTDEMLSECRGTKAFRHPSISSLLFALPTNFLKHLFNVLSSVLYSVLSFTSCSFSDDWGPTLSGNNRSVDELPDGSHRVRTAEYQSRGSLRSNWNQRPLRLTLPFSHHPTLFAITPRPLYR